MAQPELERIAEEMANTYTKDELQASKEDALHFAMNAHNNSQLDVERRYLERAELLNCALQLKKEMS